MNLRREDPTRTKAVYDDKILEQYKNLIIRL